MPLARLDPRFLVLALLTLGIGSRFSIRIPRVSAHISVSDTFIFLTLLLFGGEAAVVVAALDGFFTSLRFSRKPQTLIFNAAVVSFSTFATAEALHWTFGDVVALTSGHYTPFFLLALSLMAFAQYAFNSGIVAACGAIRQSRSFWETWARNYLWTSVTYFAGAFAAGALAKLVGIAGFYAFLGTFPIIGVVYFTYHTYLKHVETSAAQAEQAERHVEELSHYIAEQERLQREQEEMRGQFSQLEKIWASWLPASRTILTTRSPAYSVARNCSCARTILTSLGGAFRSSSSRRRTARARSSAYRTSPASGVVRTSRRLTPDNSCEKSWR
jgi:hypothetical protein